MYSLRGDRRLLHLGTGRTNLLLFSNYPTKTVALKIYLTPFLSSQEGNLIEKLFNCFGIHFFNYCYIKNQFIS